jgi:uncharacterized protein
MPLPMLTKITAICLASLLALGPLSVGAQMPSTPPVPPQVIVSASAEVRVQPDRATVVFSVETHGQTAAAVAAENARRQKSVMDALKGRIGPQDLLSTAGYSVATDDRYDSGQRKVVGYVARNTVVLETRLLDRVGAFLDAALSNGSNVVGGLRFWSSSVDSARRDALTQAVSRARADAEAIARAAGGALGNLLEVSAGGPSVIPMMGENVAFARAAQVPETPIYPTEQTVSATVNARWLFVPGK